MKHTLTCTTEELALLVTLSGYPGVGKGIAESSMGNKSPEVWESVMQATVHQLILKQLWDYNREEKEEAPISLQMEAFIKSYVESEWMVRCSNVQEEHVLMVHKIDDQTWISHLIDRDIIHEFAYIKSEELPSHIKDYYLFKDINFESDLIFQMTDQDFDLLSDKKNLEKLSISTYFTPAEGSAFSQFLTDLDAQQWSLNNISLFNLPSLEADPLLTNIMFFMPSSKGMWIVEYTDHPDKPVHIQLHSYDAWVDMIGKVGQSI